MLCFRVSLCFVFPVFIVIWRSAYVVYGVSDVRCCCMFLVCSVLFVISSVCAVRSCVACWFLLLPCYAVWRVVVVVFWWSLSLSVLVFLC